VVELNRQWDRAVNRETTSRTRFAQRAIKPGEIAQELEATDSVLGDPAVVETFVKEACHRVGNPLRPSGKFYQIEVEGLPESVKAKLPGGRIDKIAFGVPCPGATYISRTHPLTSALSEHLLDEALRTDGDRNLAARCGVIRSKDVENLTTLLLLRLRFLIKSSAADAPALAETSLVTGFVGTFGSENWLSSEDAHQVFERVTPSQNVSESERKHWVETVLRNFEAVTKKTYSLVEQSAGDLRESHERLRKTIKGHRISVEPLFPPDVLSVSVILPQPKM
jgi:hypothetical protein